MSILHKTPANSTYLIYRTLMDRGVDIGLALATVDCLVPDDDTPPWPLDDNADFEPLGPADDDGPESWPEWTDEDCWVHGPEPFEPADENRLGGVRFAGDGDPE